MSIVLSFVGFGLLILCSLFDCVHDVVCFLVRGLMSHGGDARNDSRGKRPVYSSFGGYLACFFLFLLFAWILFYITPKALEY